MPGVRFRDTLLVPSRPARTTLSPHLVYEGAAATSDTPVVAVRLPATVPPRLAVTFPRPERRPRGGLGTIPTTVLSPLRDAVGVAPV